jgi:hypothetical protein
MMTLGCGVKLDLVPSGQTIASPDNMPWRPSSQGTASPAQVQDCALAGSAHPNAMAAAPMANARLTIMPPPKLRCHSIQSSQLPGFGSQILPGMSAEMPAKENYR